MKSFESESFLLLLIIAERQYNFEIFMVILLSFVIVKNEKKKELFYKESTYISMLIVLSHIIKK